MQQNTTSGQLAASAIVKEGQKYLFIQRGKEPAKGLYAFPGGAARRNEHPKDTAIRELGEETGLIGKNPVFFARYFITQDTLKFRLYVFTVDVEDIQNAQAGDDALTLGWFTIQEALALPLAPNIADCLTRLSQRDNRNR